MKSAQIPELVIMAAGMGSRYGGLKQIDPMDNKGHIIIDFSIFDAVKAGFKTVTFIIKPEMEKEFKECIGNRIAKHINVKYVFQRNDDLPDGFDVPQGRVKPWGTAHAILSCRNSVNAPFAVINADDYYGIHAFEKMYGFLCNVSDDCKYHYAMLGYRLKNTLAEEGYVSRGICNVDTDSHMLLDVTERTRIERIGNATCYSEDGGKTFEPVSADSIVSMNLWGFTTSVFGEIQSHFTEFLKDSLEANSLKCEYYLPSVVDTLLHENKADVLVLESDDRWYGVTYKSDKPIVQAAFAKMLADGAYPQNLLD